MDERDVAAEGFQRLRLIVAYDGTAFFGWQSQAGEGPTVQQTLEQAFGALFQPTPVVYSSSRTDTGVHAMGMAVHVDIPKNLPRFQPRKLVLALNAHLPPQVRVLQAQTVAPTFHARFHASGKQYRYFIWNHPSQNPLQTHYNWHVPRTLHVQPMRLAASTLLGTHDFRAFSSTPGYPRLHTVRTLTRCDVRVAGPQVRVILEGDGFLYKMCRGIVGTLVQVGLGRFEPDSLVAMLKSEDRRLAGMTAPAQGLVLWKVFYNENSEATVDVQKRRGVFG
jgi:tRNA pseudouridine38-40 synthase